MAVGKDKPKPKKRYRKKSETPEDARLNIRQMAFVREYVLRGNAARAYRLAGYSPDNADVHAAILLTRPNIQKAIREARAEIEKEYAVSRDRVIGEVARIAFANKLDCFEVDENGNVVPDFKRLTRDKAAAIQEITVEEYMDGRGDDAERVKRTHVKLYDKQKALADLAKLMGYNEEKDAGQHNAPIEFRITVVNERGETVDLIEAPRVIDVEAEKPGLPLGNDEDNGNGASVARIRA